MRRPDAREIALASWFGALYAGTVVGLAPISFPVVQVRVADALLPLSMLFGRAAIVGFTLGCFIANFFGPLVFPFNLLDATLGALANFLACTLAWRKAQEKRAEGLEDLEGREAFKIMLMMLGVITLIVGTYLPLVFVAVGMPEYIPVIPLGPIPPILALIMSGWGWIALGTFLAVCVMGYLLFSAVKRLWERMGLKGALSIPQAPSS